MTAVKVHGPRMKPEEPVNNYVLYESKRSSVGQRGKGRPGLTYLAQIASYINVQKDNDAVKVISRYASDRKAWTTLEERRVRGDLIQIYKFTKKVRKYSLAHWSLFCPTNSNSD
jgi:hypothetical protein